MVLLFISIAMWVVDWEKPLLTILCVYSDGKSITTRTLSLVDLHYKTFCIGMQVVDICVAKHLPVNAEIRLLWITCSQGYSTKFKILKTLTLLSNPRQGLIIPTFHIVELDHLWVNAGLDC